MAPRGDERRQHRRLPERLTLRTASGAGLGTIEMETANMSLGGATCLSDRAIEPMTRLQLNIFLPSTDGRPAQLHYPIEVNAVVVRAEKLDAGGGNGHDAGCADGPGYRLALFFADMDASDRQLLARYLRDVDPN